MKNAPMSLLDRLELAAQACHAAHLLSCEKTCRDAIEALRSPTPPTTARSELVDKAQEQFELNRPLMMFLRSVPGGYQCHFENHTFIPLKRYCEAAAWVIEQLSAATPSATPRADSGPLKLDTDRQVFFYEQDHYYLSNFSAFRVNWRGRTFDTSEQAYHWTRFEAAPDYKGCTIHQGNIRHSHSAHEAFKYAQHWKHEQRPDWDVVKVAIMRDILRAKAAQHEYVRRKLLETGERELVENSWRDPYWGWGPNRDGLNMLGKLWMEVRAELHAVDMDKANG